MSEMPPETPETLLVELAYEYQCYRELAYWAKREEDEIFARVEGGRMMVEHVEKLYDDMCPESICYRMMPDKHGHPQLFKHTLLQSVVR